MGRSLLLVVLSCVLGLLGANSTKAGFLRVPEAVPSGGPPGDGFGDGDLPGDAAQAWPFGSLAAQLFVLGDRASFLADPMTDDGFWAGAMELVTAHGLGTFFSADAGDSPSGLSPDGSTADGLVYGIRAGLPLVPAGLDISPDPTITLPHADSADSNVAGIFPVPRMVGARGATSASRFARAASAGPAPASRLVSLAILSLVLACLAALAWYGWRRKA